MAQQELTPLVVYAVSISFLLLLTSYSIQNPALEYVLDRTLIDQSEPQILHLLTENYSPLCLSYLTRLLEETHG